jgi:magnesium-transporting ATPase (P-type)
VVIDTIVYGIWMAALCLAAFSLVLFGWGDGNLAEGCNSDNSPECNEVFRARATTFVCMTWFALFLAWELIDMRRSFFRMKPDSKRYFTQWMLDVWRNKFLFCGIMIGSVHSRHQRQGVPPYRHLVGVGGCRCRGDSVYWGCGAVEVVQANLFPAHG